MSAEEFDFIMYNAEKEPDYEFAEAYAKQENRLLQKKMESFQAISKSAIDESNELIEENEAHIIANAELLSKIEALQKQVEENESTGFKAIAQKLMRYAEHKSYCNDTLLLDGCTCGLTKIQERMKH